MERKTENHDPNNQPEQGIPPTATAEGSHDKHQAVGAANDPQEPTEDAREVRPPTLWQWIWLRVSGSSLSDWLIALATIVIMFTSALQWHVLSGQLAEMRSGGSDTHALAVAAKKQAENTEKLASSAADQVSKLQDGVNETHALALAAQAANGKTERTLRVTHRPWVGLVGGRVDVSLPPSFEANGDSQSPFLMKSRIAYSILNFGSSPAVREFSSFGIIPSSNPLALPPSWREMTCKAGEEWSKEKDRPVERPAHLVLPGTDLLNESSDDFFMISRDITEIRRMWIVGCIVYQDIYGDVHHTRYLFRSRPLENAKPVEVSHNPKLTYFPVAGFDLWDTDAD